jgi:hypothetical protein
MTIRYIAMDTVRRLSYSVYVVFTLVYRGTCIYSGSWPVRFIAGHFARFSMTAYRVSYEYWEGFRLRLKELKKSRGFRKVHFASTAQRTMKASRTMTFSRRALALFVLLLMVVLASAQDQTPTSGEDVPTLGDEDATPNDESEDHGEDGEEFHVPDDQHDECRDWADDGECEENSDFMHEECATSCDLHHNCYDWAEQGECEENWEFMMDNCASFCGGDEEQDEEPEF